jgi:hypothetical protein
VGFPSDHTCLTLFITFVARRTTRRTASSVKNVRNTKLVHIHKENREGTLDTMPQLG